MKQTENWPFNVEAKRRSLFPGEDPDIDQISEERLLFLFDFALTAKQKAILEDRYRDGLSAAEIVEKEHISRGRVFLTLIQYIKTLLVCDSLKSKMTGQE